jgi:hypothetical protein
MEIGVRNPTPISNFVRTQFDTFCEKKGYQLDMLVDADVADSVVVSSSSPTGEMTPDFPRMDTPDEPYDTTPRTPPPFIDASQLSPPALQTPDSASESPPHTPPLLVFTSETPSPALSPSVAISSGSAPDSADSAFRFSPLDTGRVTAPAAIEAESVDGDGDSAASNGRLPRDTDAEPAVHNDVGSDTLSFGGTPTSGPPDDTQEGSADGFTTPSPEIGDMSDDPGTPVPASPDPATPPPTSRDATAYTIRSAKRPEYDTYADEQDFIEQHEDRTDVPQQRIQIPGALEEIEVYIPNTILSTQSQRAVADVILTDFRLVLMCGVPHDHDLVDDVSGDDAAYPDGDGAFGLDTTKRTATAQPRTRLQIGSDHDLSTYVPLGMVMEVTLRTPKSGRIARRTMTGDADGSSSTVTSEVLPTRFMQLVVRCRDFRTLTLTFTGGGRDCGLESRISALHLRLVHLIDNTHTQPAALHLRCMSVRHWQLYDAVSEFKRQGAIDDGVQDGKMSSWRQCNVNEDFEVCPTYPRVWLVPRCLDDETIEESAAFRSKGRLPVLCWYNKVRKILLYCYHRPFPCVSPPL